MESKLGLFVNSVSGYPGLIAREVRLTARQEGLEVDIFDSHHDAVVQAQHLVGFEFQNPGKRLCALFVPEADAVAQESVENDPSFHAARRLLQKRVGLVFVNHGREDVVAALRGLFPDLPAALVAIDNLEFGRVQGRQLRALLPRGGTVLCVRGNPLDSACLNRSAGLRQELQSEAFVFEDVDARWEEAVAEAAVYKWLRAPRRHGSIVDAIVAHNDQMGAAARRALGRAAEEMGRPELVTIPVLGGDGLPEIGLPWVMSGVLTATVRVTLPGRTAVEVVARYWREGTPIPAVTRLPVRSHPDLGALRPMPRARP
jgi:ABC-type sugar transport system substrate-binding protein